MRSPAQPSGDNDEAPKFGPVCSSCISTSRPPMFGVDATVDDTAAVFLAIFGRPKLVMMQPKLLGNWSESRDRYAKLKECGIQVEALSKVQKGLVQKDLFEARFQIETVRLFMVKLGLHDDEVWEETRRAVIE
ncbi:hypothetical protein LTR85_007016 [Meristemomyces frigidus]|nr:hypothetical protein LTR85_007016 [Meristemomyces frigidus]